MTEAINNGYEVSSEGAVRHWIVPYARLTDTTPTPSNPAEVTSRTDSTQVCGTILSIDAVDEIAVIDFTCSAIYWQEVRNVLTYDGAAENTFGAINIGDEVYYDHSATMPTGVYLSTAPAGAAAQTNTRFGWIMARNVTDAALFPKGAATASTQECAVMQLGAGAAAT